MAVSGEARRSTFFKIVAVVLVIIVGLGVLIHFLNAGHHRPEGAAEHWLADVSDSGRKGLTVDARARADRIGSITIAAPLLPAVHDARHSVFDDLEVGKAISESRALPDGRNVVRVPFRLHEHDESGSAALKKGTLVLHRDGNAWHVVALDTRRPNEKVASEGGPHPSRAPLALWLGAIALGVLLALIAHLITRYADITAQRAAGASP